MRSLLISHIIRYTIVTINILLKFKFWKLWNSGKYLFILFFIHVIESLTLLYLMWCNTNPVHSLLTSCIVKKFKYNIVGWWIRSLLHQYIVHYIYVSIIIPSSESTETLPSIYWSIAFTRYLVRESESAVWVKNYLVYVSGPLNRLISQNRHF